MFSRRATAVLVSCLFMGLAAIAWAGVPDLDNSTATHELTEDVSIVLCPACGGDPFTAARLFGTGPGADATITVTLLDANFVPVVNYPREDVYLEANGLCYCLDGNISDANSDANGQTTFTAAMCAGGCSDDFSTQVIINGDPLNHPPLDHIMFNSPDMNCDLIINLTDIVVFAGVFYGAYDYCADFYWNGVINLSDIVVLAQHIGHACP